MLKLSSTKHHVKIFELEVDEEDEEEEMTDEMTNNEQQTATGENAECDPNVDSKATDINQSSHLGRAKSIIKSLFLPTSLIFINI